MSDRAAPLLQPGLVGRDAEVAAVRRALDAAAGGRGGVVLVAGEPGVGKTALLEQAVVDGRARQMAPLWAASVPTPGAPPLWPWSQVLRAARRQLPAEALAEAFGGRAADLGPLAGVLGLPVSAPAAGPGERFHVLDALAEGLCALAGVRPLLVVLDDLHWADPPSVQLVGFLAPMLRDVALALLAGYGDSGLAEDHPVRALLGALGSHHQHLALHGLDAADVRTLLADVRGADPGDDVARAVAAQAGGNPFFVRELARVVDGAERALPGTLHQAVAARVARLPPAAAEALAAASVLGVSVPVSDLADVLGVPAETALEWLAPAAADRLVALDAASGAVTFVHALVAEILCDDLPAPRRAELHAAAAAVLAAHAGPGDGSRMEELAHHHAGAVSVEGPEPARQAALAAAEHALGLLAHERACEHYQRALGFHDQGPPDPAGRARILLGLGCAQRHALDRPTVVATRAAAAACARQAGDPFLLAEIGLELGEPFALMSGDPEGVAVLEDALAALPAGDSAVRARVTGRLAPSLLFSGQDDRSARLAADAVAMARRLGDPATLAAVLADQLAASWRGTEAERRIAIATEVVALSEQVGDRELALRARLLRLGALLEVGERPRYEIELAAFERLAERWRAWSMARIVPLLRATLAQLDGAWEEAERRIAEAAAIARHAQDPGIELGVVAASPTLVMARGGLGAIGPQVGAAAARFPAAASFRAAAALTWAAAGRADRAAVELAHVAADDFAAVAPDHLYLVTMVDAGLAAVALGDRAAGAAIAERLAPYAGLVAMASRTGVGTIGPVAFTLGLLAELLGNDEVAVACQRQAVAIAERAVAPVWAADARFALARVLGHDEAAADEAAAARAAAVATAERFGVALPLNGIAPPPPPPALEAAAPTAHQAGETWVFTYGGQTALVRHTVGLGHLTRLLAAPGQEVTALELVHGGAVAPAARTPVLDETAKRAYQRRVAELQDEIDRAAARDDRGRQERAEAELSAVVDELRRAAGLGGRDRAVVDEAERARFAVTKSLRTAIRRVEAVHPELGRHLAATVHTGTACRYSGPVAWVVRRDTTAG